MIRSAVALIFAVFAVSMAFATGPWLELAPLGGVEIDTNGLDRAALERRLDEIAAECAGKPYIVTRTKQLAAVFDNVQLAVNTNDMFVHWHPDTQILAKRVNPRVQRIAGRSKFKLGDDGGYVSNLDLSHTCPDWQSVIALGPKGLADRALKRKASAKTDEERMFLDCVAEVYEAFGREIRRWADYAESKGMREVAAVLRENAAHEPRTFREALQWALVYDRAQEVEDEDVRSQGLFDRLFIDFYRADLKSGRETRESAKRLIADWYTRFWSQQHPNNKNIAFGGYDANGEPVWNELTELGVEVFRELGRINPKLTYRFGRKTPRWQLEKVTRCIAEGKTSIVFACEETLFDTFRRHGKEERDLCNYVLIGCYEPGIGGREVIASMAGELNLPKYLETVFAPGRELPANGEEFERAYLRELSAAIRRFAAEQRELERRWPEVNPAPLFSGAFRDCIANARDYSEGGCRYNSSGIDCVGLGTAADSLAAIRYLVDEQKLVTMAKLRDILAANWEGYEELRLKARNAAPKWGNNDNRADAVAKRIYEHVCAAYDAEPNGHGGRFQAGFWSIDNDMRCGKRTGATPDGRKAGETHSRNNAATAGCGHEGPSALMLSNLKLDLANSPNGHIMDIILPASLKTSPNGATKIADVIAAYFAKGGQCLHLNCFDSKTLKDAFEHPERYPDLQVRVCGWNVRWADLSPAERRYFIITAETQETR